MLERVVYELKYSRDRDRESRKLSWLLVLGIDPEVEDKKMEEFYRRFTVYNPDDKRKHEIFMEIKKDVLRTGYGKYREVEPESGQNKLQNILLAYTLTNESVGYTQGMNFVVALILEIVEEEFLAYKIFTHLMKISKWFSLYTESTPKLFDICKKIKHKLERHH